MWPHTSTCLENHSWAESDQQWWLLLIELVRLAKGFKEVGKVMEGQLDQGS